MINNVSLALFANGMIVGVGLFFLGWSAAYLYALFHAPTFESRKTWAICSAALTLYAIAFFILAEITK